MANPEHLAKVLKGTRAWNAWRSSRPKIIPDLSGANLSGHVFDGANFASVDLERANLRDTTLTGSSFAEANLAGADLHKADLSGAVFFRTNLRGAALRGACLYESDCRFADFTKTNLVSADISWSRMGDAKLVEAVLSESNLSESELGRANLNDASLSAANLSDAYLPEATLCNANLRGANLSGAYFRRTDLTNASFGHTMLGDNDLSGALGLDTVRHNGPSVIGVQTFYLSKGNIPESFLRGCGIPESFLTYVKSLVGNPIEFYSCFISYSTKDQDFADRLYADLHAKRVRCWFAPHDIRAGRKLHEQIDEAIRLHDKLLLILSPASMNSEWVKTEIAKARKREMRDTRRVLFPIGLVPFETLRDWECFDADTGKDSAREIREYFIPDFSAWKDHDSYQESLERLINDLRASDSPK